MDDINLTFFQALASILVFVIGFFLKATYTKISVFMEKTTESINALNINVEKLISNHDSSLDLIKKNQDDIKDLKYEVLKLRDFKHKHENDYENMLKLIDHK